MENFRFWRFFHRISPAFFPVSEKENNEIWFLHCWELFIQDIREELLGKGMPHLHPRVAYPTPQMEGGRGWAGWIRFLWISSVLNFHRALSGGILYWGRHQFSVFHFETFSSVTVLVSNHSSVLFIYLSHFIRFRTRGYHNFVGSVLPSLPKIHPNKPKNAIFNSCVSCCLSVTKRKNTCFCWMTTTFFLLTKNVVKIMNNEQVWKSLLMSIFICSFKKYFS